MQAMSAIIQMCRVIMNLKSLIRHRVTQNKRSIHMWICKHISTRVCISFECHARPICVLPADQEIKVFANHNETASHRVQNEHA